MIATEASFYVTGGTLRQDAPSYVERQADHDLFEGLMRGEFCYVLTSRQMGKSSLMVRTAARLREAGVRVAVLDLTAIGQNLSPQQWYDGLLSRLARQLDLEDELEDFWDAHERLGPLQRWMTALEQVVLPRLADGRRGDQGDGETGRPESTIPPLAPSPRRLGRPVTSLVVFVDEIDAVRSLPFSADEFFAAIRECYNRRTQEPEYERLTFCLLGVATPADLIQNATATPFNIGRRIELRNFTEAEAAPLAGGFTHHGDTGTEGEKGRRGEGVIGEETSASRADGAFSPLHPLTPSPVQSPRGSASPTPEAQMLLQRILYWTGGHPYLTQRLCQAVAAESSTPTPNPRPPTPRDVDRLCEEMFLTRKARETEDNLTFVRSRLLDGGMDLAALLERYRQVWSGKPVPDDEASPLVSVLKLSGVVRPGSDGTLQVGNRIYARAFDQEWVRENMPDAELRRQRRAFWRGVLRTTLVSAAVIAVIGTLAILAAMNARRATTESRRANQMLVRVFESEGVRRMEDADPAAALVWFLEAMRRGDDPSREEARRIRIGALLRECPQPIHVWFLPYSSNSGEFSKDGKRVLTASSDPDRKAGEVRVWDAQTGAPVGPPLTFQNGVQAAFSPDGRRLVTATGSVPGRVGASEARVWDAQTGRPLTPSMKHASPVTSLRFSADGRRVLTVSQHERKYAGEARVWDAQTGAPLGPPLKVDSEWPIIEFGPDGRRVLLANTRLSQIETGETTEARVWDAQTGKPLAPPMKHEGAVILAAFSRDGQRLATATARQGAASNLGAVRVWDVATGRPLTLPMEVSNQEIAALGFSDDGTRLLTTGNSGPSRVWDARTGKAIARIENPSGGSINQAVLSPDGTRVLTTGEDAAVRVWDAQTGKPLSPPLEHGGRVSVAAFSPDGTRVLAASEDRTVRVWKLGGRRPLLLPAKGAHVFSKAWFSPDGRRVLTAIDDPAAHRGEARVWDSQTGRPLTPPMKHDAGVGQARFSPDGRRVLTATMSWRQPPISEARVWDAQTGRALTLPMKRVGPIFDLDFSSDGRRVLTISDYWPKHKYDVCVWDAQTGKLLIPRIRPVDFVAQARFSPDGRWVLTGGNSDATLAAGQAQIWDAQTGRSLVVMKHQSRVNSVEFSKDGRRVLTGSADRTARVWDAQTGHPLTPPMQHVSPVYAVDFSADGRQVVTGCYDGSVAIWDAATGRRLHALLGHKQFAAVVSFSKDGRRVLTGSNDKTVRIWEAQTGQPLAPPMQHEAEVLSAEFSPDGRRIVTAGTTFGGRGGARVWDATPDPRPLEELFLLAQVLSSHRLDETGVLVPLDPEAFRRAWETLHARSPGAFAERQDRFRPAATGGMPMRAGKG